MSRSATVTTPRKPLLRNSRAQNSGTGVIVSTCSQLANPNYTHRPAGFWWNPPFCHNLPMCGRYRLSRRKQVVEEYFDSVSDEPDWAPRYNIAPTQPVAVIRQHSEKPVRELSLMRWGQGIQTLSLAPRLKRRSAITITARYFFSGLFDCTPCMFDSSEVKVLYQPDGGEG
jgi:hypothetical protein